jgi:starvation-inducible outer membrane lipoprotein
MKRSAFFVTQSIALVGAVMLTLALAGCGTLPQPISADASAGLIPSGRGAP